MKPGQDYHDLIKNAGTPYEAAGLIRADATHYITQCTEYSLTHRFTMIEQAEQRALQLENVNGSDWKQRLKEWGWGSNGKTI